MADIQHKRVSPKMTEPTDQADGALHEASMDDESIAEFDPKEMEPGAMFDESDENSEEEEASHSPEHIAPSRQKKTIVSHSLQATYMNRTGTLGVGEKLSVLVIPFSGWFLLKWNGVWNRLCSSGSNMSFEFPHNSHFLHRQCIWKHLVCEDKHQQKHLKYHAESPAMIAFSKELDDKGLLKGDSHNQQPSFKFDVLLAKMCNMILPLVDTAHPIAQVRKLC